MRHLKAAFLLLAISGAAGRDTLQQQVEQGRGYAGDQEGFSAEPWPYSHHAQANTIDAATQELDLIDQPLSTHHIEGKAAEKAEASGAHYAQANTKVHPEKAAQVYRTQDSNEGEATHVHADEDEAADGRSHAEKERHSQGSVAAEATHVHADKALTGTHPSAGKAAEAVAHVAKPSHPHHTPIEASKGEKVPKVTSNHGKAEAIYWDARHKANALRKTFPTSAFKSKQSNLTDIVRVWDFYAPDYNCPLLKERVGRIGDGGKWVCGMRMLQEMRHCLVYSLGSQGDTSFEDEFLERTACEVHTFDPFLSTGTEAAVQGRPGLHFHPVGILGSADGRVGSGGPEHWQSLENIMTDMGHEWLEVLKIDIEGSEWGLFADFYRNPGATLPATNLMVEFHMPNDVAEVLQVIDMILADGFRVFSAEPNYYCEEGACAALMTELAFVKVSPEGLVCIPHGHLPTGESILAQLPSGCLNPPNRGLITN